MKLFRSEESLEAWLRTHRRRRGGVMDLETLRVLARRWYGDRLDPSWQPRTPAESQRILEQCGLGGPFWRLQR